MTKKIKKIIITLEEKNNKITTNFSFIPKDNFKYNQNNALEQTLAIIVSALNLKK